MIIMGTNLMSVRFLFLALLAVMPFAQSQAIDFYVSTTGDDLAPGTKSRPFATLERARAAIGELKANSEFPQAKVVHVYLRGGQYRITESFVLTKDDSGTADSPIVYAAYAEEKVKLTGGVDIPLADFELVSDPSVMKRLPTEAHGKVWKVNLKQRGITNFGTLGLYGASVMPPYTVGPNSPELFVNGLAMTLARWPNSDYALVDKVVEVGSNLRMWQADMVGRDDRRGTYVPPEKRDNPPKGFAFTVASDRVLRWTTATDAWLFGYWYWDWSDQSVQVASIDVDTGTIRTRHASGYSVRENQRFFAFNLLEELDSAGEWYLDREHGDLYLFPKQQDRQGVATLSLNTQPLIKTNQASYVTFRGLMLEVTRGDAIHIRDGQHVVVDRCDLGNLSGKAVVVEGGNRHSIRNCFVHDTGAGGVRLSGGDRATLTPSGHTVENNEITRFSRLRKTYAEAIVLDGVGMRAAQNHIHDAPHAAIHFMGNDHLIELNEIHHVLTESDDAGAIYSGRRLTYWGNIVRYNYLHDIQGLPPEKTRFRRILTHGVYLDDALSGIEISGNVFRRCSNAICVKGSDNRLDANVIIECRQSISDHSRKPGGTYSQPLRFDQPDRLPLELDVTILNDILSVPYRSRVWRERYPGLATSLEQTYGPWRVSIVGNVLVATPGIQATESMTQLGRIEGNHVWSESFPPEDSQGMADWLSLIPSRVPDFPPIPFHRIGRQRVDRTSR